MDFWAVEHFSSHLTKLLAGSGHIQFVDQELSRLQAQVAAMQTARNAYVKALKAALPVVAGGDTIKLS